MVYLHHLPRAYWKLKGKNWILEKNKQFILIYISFDFGKTLPCEHYFCKLCIDQWLVSNKNPSCPECRIEFSVFDLTGPTIFIKRAFENLKIKCEYNDCDSFVPYDEIQKHQLVCDSALVDCSVCGSRIAKNKMKNHMETSVFWKRFKAWKIFSPTFYVRNCFKINQF